MNGFYWYLLIILCFPIIQLVWIWTIYRIDCNDKLTRDKHVSLGIWFLPKTTVRSWPELRDKLKVLSVLNFVTFFIAPVITIAMIIVTFKIGLNFADKGNKTRAKLKIQSDRFHRHGKRRAGRRSDQKTLPL